MKNAKILVVVLIISTAAWAGLYSLKSLVVVPEEIMTDLSCYGEQYYGAEYVTAGEDDTIENPVNE